MKKILGLSLFFILSFFSVSSGAKEMEGFVRTVNHGGHSFSVDGPPLQRVWVLPSTQFDSGSGYEAFEKIKDGDRVRVEGNLQSNGLLVARKVTLLAEPVVKEDGKVVELGRTFLIEENQKVQVKGESLTLQGAGIIDDYCKQGRYCEGDGTISFRLKINHNGKKQEVLLSSQGGRKPVVPIKKEVMGYTFELIEVGENSASLVVRK